MQTVGTIGTIIGRDHLTGMDGLRQLINLLLAADAHTLTVGLYDVTGKERHILGLQLQVTTERIIYLLHLLGPVGITCIRLALMHEDTLDHAILLGFFSQRNQSFIRIVVVCFEHSLHPTGSLCLHVIGYLTRHKTFNLDTTDGHMDNTNLDIRGKRSYQCTTKPVSWCKTGIRTTKRSRCLTPLSHLPAFVGKIHGRHQEETRTRTG